MYFLLDSDILDYYLHEPNKYPHLCEKIDDADNKALIRLPIVTVEEAAIGVINELRKDYIQTSNHIVEAYQFLSDLMDDLRRFIVLPFDNNAYQRFQTIPRNIRAKAPNDCRIAAIALSLNSTVVTNNAKDFERIEEATGVKVKYWATAPLPPPLVSSGE